MLSTSPSTGPDSTPWRVSVIVPVRNRRDLLRRALDAIDAQTYDDFELIVVDDGSTDGADLEAEGSTVHGRPVRVLRAGGRGAVGARLLGVEAATGSVLAFTDSDCEPDPGWLAAAVAAIDGGAALAHGPTVPVRPLRPLERSVSERDGGLFPTCNLAVTRAAYEAVGGFDGAAAARWGFRVNERAKGLGFGEDTIFGWAIARTAKAEFSEAMLVHHYVFPADGREWLSRSWQVAAFPAIVKEVPELRRTMVHHKVLFTHRSRVPFYVTVAALLTRRPTVVAVALGWWALHRFRHTLRNAPMPIPERVGALPAQMALDAVQAAALVTGSVKAKTLLL